MANVKKTKKTVLEGNVYIQATFNNTIITVTDLAGNAVSWASAGMLGFRGAKKSTPYAAQTTCETAAKKAMDFGLREVNVFVKGPGVGNPTQWMQATQDTPCLIDSGSQSCIIRSNNG